MNNMFNEAEIAESIELAKFNYQRDKKILRSIVDKVLLIIAACIATIVISFLIGYVDRFIYGG